VRWWHDRFHVPLARVMERLFYSRVAPPARVLDLCCGTGHLSRVLQRRGYSVVGVDRSLDMLRTARFACPDLRLVCADARALAVSGFDAAVCTFDSVNHLTAADDVHRLFECVRWALDAGGLFLFDVNTERAYVSEWGKRSAIVTSDAALLVRGEYDTQTRIGRTRITAVRLLDGWQRVERIVEQRCYAVPEIESALTRAGFDEIRSCAASAAGMEGDIGVGRVFFTARVAEG
jgi:SAM-dependent methyltransferase